MKKNTDSQKEAIALLAGAIQNIVLANCQLLQIKSRYGGIPEGNITKLGYEEPVNLAVISLTHYVQTIIQTLDDLHCGKIH